MTQFRILPVIALCVLVASCVSPSPNLTAVATPASDKPLVVSDRDQAFCMNYAAGQIAGRSLSLEGDVVHSDTITGSAAAESVTWSLQQRYEIAYSQYVRCMYIKGGQVEVLRSHVLPRGVR